MKSASSLHKFFVFTFISLCPFLFVNSTQATQANEATQSEFQKVFRVATVDNYQPCSDLVDGRYLGLSVDLWRHVAEKLNIHYQMYTVHTFSDAIEAAASGEYDLITSCHNITDERLRIVDFSIPYREDGLAILSRKAFNIEDFLLYRILSDKFLLGSLSLLAFLSVLGSLVIYKIDYGRLDIRDFCPDKRAQLMKTWTMFMVGEYGDRSSMTKGMPIIILFFFVRLAVITSLVGNSVSEVFKTEKAKDSHYLSDSQITSIVKSGVAVASGTLQERWLDERITSLTLTPRDKSRILRFDGEEVEALEALNTRKVDHILSELSLLNTFRSSLDRFQEYYISVENPIKEYQAFVFGSNLSQQNRKAINMALVRLRELGEINRLENVWQDHLY